MESNLEAAVEFWDGAPKSLPSVLEEAARRTEKTSVEQTVSLLWAIAPLGLEVVAIDPKTGRSSAQTISWAAVEAGVHLTAMMQTSEQQVLREIQAKGE